MSDAVIIEIEKGDVILEIKNLENHLVHGIDFHLRKGEILGVAGLMGAGRTELAKTLYGYYKVKSGEILLEEFLNPMEISQYRLAKDISVPARRINEIVHGKRAITPDTALRLSRYFGLSERFWINMQARYDLEIEKDRLQDRLVQEVQVYVGDQ